MSGALLALIGGAPLAGTPDISTLSGASGSNPGAPQSTTLIVRTDGTLSVTYGDTAGGTNSDDYDWLSPKSGMSRFSVRWTNTAGAITIGTAGTWQDMSTSRSFGITDAVVGGGAASATGTLEIALTSDTGTVLASKSGIVLSAIAS